MPVFTPRGVLAQMILCPLIVVSALIGAVLFDRWWIPMTIMFLIALTAIAVFIATVFDLLSDGSGPLERP